MSYEGSDFTIGGSKEFDRLGQFVYHPNLSGICDEKVRLKHCGLIFLIM